MANTAQKKPVDLKENPNYAYEIDNDDESGIRIPDGDIPESQKTPEWFVDNIHYIASFYNVPLENVLTPTGGEFGQSIAATGNVNDRRDLPVARMLRYMQYYQGRQDNLDYNHLTTNVTGGNLQAAWIKGQDIAELINFMKGNMLERVSNLQITAKALSEQAVSEKQDFRTKLLMKYEFKDIFQDIANQGADFSVGPNQQFTSKESIDDFMDKNFKQYGTDVAIAMAKNFWYTNYCLDKFLRLFVECTITGIASTQHYVQNGKQYMRTLPSYQIILDTRHDDEYNRDAEFIGIAETLTPNEIFSRFKNLSKTQKEEIKKMARSSDLGGEYNRGFTNFNWWNYNAKREECVVTCVTGYWLGAHDMGLKKTKNKFNTEKITKTEEGESGEYVLDDIHKGTLIGNRFLVDWGYDDNVVEDPHDKSRPLFPILRYLPNMIGGEPRSIVSRLYQVQDEIDALNYKVREMVGRAKGKVYVLLGGKLGGNGMDVEILEKNLSSIGIHVMTSTGETGQDGNNKDFAQMLDWTLDPNIMRIEEMVKIRRDLMKEYTSVSNVSLGMQTTYMGMGERNSAIGQSTYGLASLYHGFMDFIQMNLQYAINVGKHLYAMNGGTDEAAFVVGDKGVLYLKIMENFKFEDFLIMLELNDAIDETGRKEINQLALAWAQNGVVGPDTYLKVRRQETYSGAEKVLEYAVKVQKQEQAQQRAEQAQQEQAMQAQQLQAQQQQTAMVQSGMDNREHVKAGAKIDTALIQKQPDLNPPANQAA